jgi:hypothetical protein
MADNMEEDINLIKLKLQQLSEAHEAVAAQQSADLLETQRFIANFVISTAGQIAYDLLRSSSNSMEQIISQLIADESAAFVELKSSKNPLYIANEFQKKCNAPLVKLGLVHIKF